MNITIGLPEGQGALSLDAFSETELELIGLFIVNTNLGRGITPHRDAAFTILEKLIYFFGEEELDERIDEINMAVQVQDQNCNVVDSISINSVAFDIRP